MEMLSIVGLVVGLVIVWKFRDLIGAAAEMGEDEFKVVHRKQKIRLHKERIKDTTAVMEMSNEAAMNDMQFADFFRGIDEITVKPVKPTVQVKPVTVTE